MAEAFNKEAPDINPANFIGWSREIKEPQPNTGTGMLLKDLGQAYDTGVKGVHATMENELENRIYKGVDQQKDIATSALEGMLGIGSQTPGASGPADASTSPGFMQSFFAQGQAQKDMPAAVANLDQNLSALKASAQGGHIPQLYFDMKVDSQAKAVRNDWPGWRKEVDEIFNRATGKHIANEYMASLEHAVNLNTAKANAEHEKIFNEALSLNKEGVPGMYSKILDWQSKKIGDGDMLEFMNKANYFKYDAAQAESRRKKQEADQSYTKAQAKDDLDKELTQNVALHWDAVQTAGGNTHENIRKFADAANRGLVDIPSEKFSQWARQEKANRQQMYDYLYGVAVKRGYLKTLTPDELDERINKQLVSFDQVIGALDKKDLSLADMHMHDAQRRAEDFHWGVINHKDPDIRGWAQLSEEARKIGGDQVFKDWMAGSAFLQHIPAKLETYAKSKQASAIVQPRAAQGDPTTLNGVVGDLLKMSGNDGDPKTQQEFATTAEAFVDSIRLFADPNTSLQEKKNLATFFFDAKNRPVINNFKREYTDPQTGEQVNGQWSVYTRLTDENVTKEMAKLKDANIQKMYQNWNEVTFRTLAAGSLGELAKMGEMPWVTVRWDTGENGKTPQIHIDHTPTYLGPNERNQGFVTYDRQNQFYHLQNEVDLFNKGLTTFSKVEEAAGLDPSAAALGLLRDTPGMDITKFAGVPKQIVDAILASRPKPLSAKDIASGKAQDRVNP